MAVSWVVRGRTAYDRPLCTYFKLTLLHGHARADACSEEQGLKII